MVNRRTFLKQAAVGAAGLSATTSAQAQTKKPNILFCIADDWSWPHASIYGDKVVNTPAFDRVAKMGCLFTQSFCAAPQCAPNRASILTGRNIWQNEEAGTHSSIFPGKLVVYPDMLENNGYTIGSTGKTWGPGNYELGGWERNPAGPSINKHQYEDGTPQGIRNNDYAANFIEFIEQWDKESPFYFWYGSSEPHRGYKKGIGIEQGKNPDDVVVPDFFPDTPEVRSDILDYAVEVEWFDQHLGRILDHLEEIGELDNTLIIATSDNGMPFPRAKANLYEYGIHMPLAVCWPEKIKSGRTIDDPISFIDFAPTMLDAAGIEKHPDMTGSSFLDILTSDKEGHVDSNRKHILTGRERHSNSRYDNWGYPARAIRTDEYLYIWNIKPERWPAGTPPWYHDIDACPTMDYLMENRFNEEIAHYLKLATAKRPEEELFNIKEDPHCLKNLAEDDKYTEVKDKLVKQLKSELAEQGDPRMLGYGYVFESYPRFGGFREYLGGFGKRGEYNPEYFRK